MKNKFTNWRHILAHPLVVAIVSAAITAFITNLTVAKEYISFNSVNTLLEKYFVESGYVDKTILDYDTADKQFEMIEGVLEDYSSSTQAALENLGLSSDKVSGMSHSNQREKLPSLALETYNDNQNYIKKNQDLTDSNIELKKQLKEYSDRESVEVVESNLVIDGELMNTGDAIKNAVAIVDGNAYYSQSMLNTYILNDSIKYDKSENSVVYGNLKPEKTKFSWDTMVSDAHGDVEVYTLGSNEMFPMGISGHEEGLVLTSNDYFYIHLRKEYSKLSFTYGHVDNTSQGNLELTILAIDDNGETYTTILRKLILAGEMVPKTVEIPLNYASAIKLVVSDGDNDARYGLANIYLYS